MKVTVTAPAKINLFLDIIGRRNDGYHLLNMILQSVGLYDTVTVWKNGEGTLELFCSREDLSTGESNLACRAAALFFKELELGNPGVSIKLKKRIPVGAGLAGGSADAAAVLLALDRLFKTKLPLSRLCELASKLGADVPFCLQGGTMQAEGTGTILMPLPDLTECFLVLAKPDFSVSTAEAYALSDEHTNAHRPDLDGMIGAICSGDLESVGKRLFNSFETVLGFHEIKEIKEIMLRQGALGACMTGSGPTVFGIFSEWEKAESCADELKKLYEEVYLCEPRGTGCEIEE